MNVFKKIIFIILLFQIIFLVTGCSKKEVNMEDKILAEIDYCENQILIFLRKVEYKEYIKKDILDWEKISGDNKIFTDSITVIKDDFAFANVDNKKIEELKGYADNMNKFCTLEDLDSLIIEYGNFYNTIISIRDNKNRQIKNISMNLYLESLKNNETELSKLISDIKKKYKELKEDKEFFDTNKLSLNKINDNIKDLKKCYDEKDYDRLRKHCLKIIEIM